MEPAAKNETPPQPLDRPVRLRGAAQASAAGYAVRIAEGELRRTRLKSPETFDVASIARTADALIQFAAHWRADDLGISFVKPVAILDDGDAVLAERVDAEPFFSLLRRLDLRRRALPGGAEDQGHAVLHRVGAALARYHMVSTHTTPWHGADFARRIEETGQRLARLGWPGWARSMLPDALDHLSTREGAGERTATVVGLDIRNLLVRPDGRLLLLDPGRIRIDFREADVARFLITCRIVYWGHPLFAAGLRPDRSYEEAFLSGYYGAAAPPPLLALLTIKEMLEIWRKAYQALRLKRWPAPLKAALKRHYIERVMGRWLADDLTALRGL